MNAVYIDFVDSLRVLRISFDSNVGQIFCLFVAILLGQIMAIIGTMIVNSLDASLSPCMRSFTEH